MIKFKLFIFTTVSLFVYAQENKSGDIRDTLLLPKEIEEIIIKGQRKKQFVDKSVYTFDPEVVKRARYSSDLLKTLPELAYDLQSNKITSATGDKLLVLVNGIEATEMQLRGIQPQNVKKVEYYDIPPTRWINRADRVVNIITHNSQIGYGFGIDNFVSPTMGFVNTLVNGNYTHGKSNFAVEYYLGYRNYNNRQSEKNYNYSLDGSKYRSNYLRKDKFGYTHHNTNLRYSNVDVDRYVFQSKFTLESYNNFSDGAGKNIFIRDNILQLDGMIQNSGFHYVRPALDLYYSKSLSKKDELIFNLVGSYFTNTSYQDNREWVLSTGKEVFGSKMNLVAKQSSVVGEVAYAHTFDKVRLNAGYRISANGSKNSLVNLNGLSNFTVNYVEQYMYSESIINRKKMTYRFGAGLTNINNKTAVTKENLWVFTPRIVMGYKISKHRMLRLSSSYVPTSPASDQLSPNLVQILPNIFTKGNPNLKSEKKWQNSLMYTYNNKFFDFRTSVFYDYVAQPISRFYLYEEKLDGYALTYQNGQSLEEKGINFTGSVKPLGTEILALKILIAPMIETLRLKSGEVLQNKVIKNNFILTSEYKSFAFQYQFNIPVYALNGGLLSTNENKNNFMVSYRLKDWNFNLGMLWIGRPSKYLIKTYPRSPVKYTSSTRIYNNRSMLVFGVGYNFSKGKNLKVKRKINNELSKPISY
ncbi:MAG: TonB-dependent receptor [Bergeyella sp.]|nr:TonB-dependent receptor [Bergeyella sp.]